MESKGDVLEDISRLLGLTGYELGVGSSVPRQFISEVAEALGISDEGTGVDSARRTVESVGLSWPADGDSLTTPSGGGGTITLAGLVVLREAVIARLEANDVILPPESAPLEARFGTWTYFIGQTVTRSMLLERFGIAKQGELLISPVTNEVFVFLDSADARVVNFDASNNASRVVVSFKNLDFASSSKDLEILRVLSTSPRRRRSIRLFEGLTAAVEYLGEFEVTSIESESESDPATLSTFRIRITLQCLDKLGLLVSKTHDGSEPEIDFLFLEPYEDVDLETLTDVGSLPFEVDPNQIESGRREHFRIQNGVATWLRDFGLVPLKPRVEGLQFDLAWRVADQIFVAEVKSCTPENLIKQFRLGLGQVLDYAEEFSAQPVLILGERPPTDRLIAVAARAQVTLLWPELLSQTDPRSL